MRFLYKILYTVIVIFCSIHISVGQRGGATNPTISVETDITHLTNEISSGEIEYEVTVSTGWARGTQINSLEVLDSDGQTVYEHLDSGPTGIVPSLSIGSYKFTGSISVRNSSGYFVSVYFNHTVWVGLEAKWCDSKDMNIAFDNTVTRNASILNYAGSRSNNILQSGDGWVQLNAIYGSGEDSKSFLVLGNTQDLSNFSPSGSFQYIEFYSTESGGGVRVNYQSSPGVYSMTTISNNPDDVVRLIRKNGSVEIELNNDISSSFVFPATYSGILNIGVFSNEIGDGFQNVVTSMPGGSALSSWDGDLNTGIINVDISDLGIIGPFRYLLSEGVIPNLTDTYSFFKDSLGLALNSSGFLSGNDSELLKFYNGLENQEYYLAVFDNSGHRIFSDKRTTQPPFEFESQSNITIDGEIISAPNSNGLGTLDLYAVEGGDEKISIEIDDNSKDGFFGLNSSSTSVITYADIEYGFYIKSDILYTIINGQQSTSAYTISAKTLLTIEIINGVINLKSSNGIDEVLTLNSTYEYQASIGINREGSLKLNFQNWKGKKYVVNQIQLEHLDCSESASASFSFSINGGPQSSIPLIYNITDESGTMIYSNGTGYTWSPITVNQSIIGQFINPGIYTISGTVSTGGTFSAQVYVGYEVQWEDELAYSFIPNTYSVNRQVDQNGIYSFAKSQNVGLDADYGWIEFSPVTNGPSGSFFPEEHNFLKIAGQSANASLPNVNDDFLYFGQLGNGALLMFTFVNGNYDLDIISSAARVRTLIQNNMVRVYVQNSPTSNYSLKSTFSSVDRSHMLRPMSLAKHNGFENVITSFPCLKQRYELLSFAKLRASNDGSYVNGAEGKLKIYFKENYEQLNTQNLDIKIYDASRTQYTVSNTDIHSFDDNRYELDLNNLNLVDGGYYTLEVIVSKDVRQYLKFKYND